MPYSNPEEQKKSQQKYYLQNKKEYAHKLKQRRYERALWFDDLKTKKTWKCKQCGEDHPACIEFHHVDRKTKTMSVSDLVSFAYKEEAILQEIEKCLVLCSNCHKKHHWLENRELGVSRILNDPNKVFGKPLMS